MSFDLYRTMLLWNGHSGLAKHEFIEITLRSWPIAAIPWLDVQEIKFQPEILKAEIRVTVGWRPMEREEKVACMHWLREVTEPSRARMRYLDDAVAHSDGAHAK